MIKRSGLKVGSTNQQINIAKPLSRSKVRLRDKSQDQVKVKKTDLVSN